APEPFAFATCAPLGNRHRKPTLADARAFNIAAFFAGQSALSDQTGRRFGRRKNSAGILEAERKHVEQAGNAGQTSGGKRGQIPDGTPAQDAAFGRMDEMAQSP